MKVPCILTHMVTWSNCHLSPNSRLVTKSGLVSIREKYLTKATHLTGRKRYSWSIKSNIDDHIRKLDTKIRNKETELNALYTKIQKLEEELATLYHKKLISKNWKQLKCH